MIPINNIDEFLVIPPIDKVSNQQNLRKKQQKYPLSKEEQAIKDREIEQLTEQLESERDDAKRIAATDDAAAAESQDVAFQEMQAALDVERRQLQQIQDATDNAQQQMAEDNNMAVMADILLQMAEMIQQMIDDRKHDTANASSREASVAIQGMIPQLRVEDVLSGTLSPEEVLKQHLENLALFIRRNAETAYQVRQSPVSRNDATPVVPPLYREDEYV